MQIFFVHSVVGMHGRNLQHVADKFARQTQTELRMRMHNIYLLFLRFPKRFVHTFDSNPAIFERQERDTGQTDYIFFIFIGFWICGGKNDDLMPLCLQFLFQGAD